MGLKFGLIGDGKIAPRHKQAVTANGGVITELYDPKYKSKKTKLNKKFFQDKDYIIICSPSHFHREHVRMALSYDKKIICEKPLVLPWEPIIDDDRISVVLQLRWMNLPETADVINVVMARNKEYFETWEGNAELTGGLFYHLFIHYIDLAIKLKARFVGSVIPEGKQIRRIDNMDMFSYDMNDLYARMYNDIINHDGGVKPHEMFYIHWVLERCGWTYGINGEDLMNKIVSIDFRNGIDI
jgi:predicted dehydrogenase